MAYNPNNPNGSATSANSAPVVIASDQASVPVAATLNAETTKVIGTVNQGTSPWVANISQINSGTAANSQLIGSLAVGGGVATNTALTSSTYPVVIAGSDYGGTPKLQNVKADSSGNQYVISGSATGSSVPSTAFPLGVSSSAGNLTIPNAESTNSDNRSTTSAGQTLETIAIQFAYAPNGSTSGFDRIRTPTIFKTATATSSGNTAVWTPTSGKKFRLMRFMIILTSNVSLASGAVEEITFQDSTTDIGIGFSEFVPTTAITTTQGGFTSGWVDIGNGKLSASANNVLNINLGTALTSGECRVTVCGTEE